VTRPHRFTGAALLLCAAAALLSACQSGSAGSATPPASRAASDTASGSADVWARYVACARSNGYPGWPDAVVAPDGRATFPEAAGFDIKQARTAIQDACGPVLRDLPPQIRPRTPTAAELAQIRRYSACIRGHGIPHFPDPDASGAFPPGGEEVYGREFFSPQRAVAERACEDVWPSSYQPVS
jgi:hypothetical protein